MKESGKYLNLWRKYLPVIKIQLKNSKNGARQLPLSRHEFEAVGEREKAGYHFNLVLENGKVINNLSGSAVARDFRDVILSDDTIKETIAEGSYKINMDTNFILHFLKL